VGHWLGSTPYTVSQFYVSFVLRWDTLQAYITNLYICQWMYHSQHIDSVAKGPACCSSGGTIQVTSQKEDEESPNDDDYSDFDDAESSADDSVATSQLVLSPDVFASYTSPARASTAVTPSSALVSVSPARASTPVRLTMYSLLTKCKNYWKNAFIDSCLKQKIMGHLNIITNKLLIETCSRCGCCIKRMSISYSIRDVFTPIYELDENRPHRNLRCTNCDAQKMRHIFFSFCPANRRKLKNAAYFF